MPLLQRCTQVLQSHMGHRAKRPHTAILAAAAACRTRSPWPCWPLQDLSLRAASVAVDGAVCVQQQQRQESCGLQKLMAGGSSPWANSTWQQHALHVHCHMADRQLQPCCQPTRPSIAACCCSCCCWHGIRISCCATAAGSGWVTRAVAWTTGCGSLHQARTQLQPHADTVRT